MVRRVFFLRGLLVVDSFLGAVFERGVRSGWDAFGTKSSGVILQMLSRSSFVVLLVAPVLDLWFHLQRTLDALRRASERYKKKI